MSLPASTSCPGAIRESARVQELLGKLEGIRVSFRTSTKLLTSPKLRTGQPHLAMFPKKDG
jgi:hypothetical protein